MFRHWKTTEPPRHFLMQLAWKHHADWTHQRSADLHDPSVEEEAAGRQDIAAALLDAPAEPDSKEAENLRRSWQLLPFPSQQFMLFSVWITWTEKLTVEDRWVEPFGAGVCSKAANQCIDIQSGPKAFGQWRSSHHFASIQHWYEKKQSRLVRNADFSL